MNNAQSKSPEKLVVKEENCLTDFIHSNAPRVKITEAQLAAIHQTTKKNMGLTTPHSSSTDISHSSNTKETIVNGLKYGALNLGGVKNDCWKNKDDVNAFYHNLLSQFIFIYLDCGNNSIEQIDFLLQQINSGNISEAISFLKSVREKFIQSLSVENKPAMVVTNAANPTNLGGAVTYKKGTVEEALCRKSELFLYMLLYHADGEYQKNILATLLTEFKEMLVKNKLPIVTKKDSEEIAGKWLNHIYKVSRDGYYIDPANVHVNENVLFTGVQALPSLSTLVQPGYAAGCQFVNHFQVATVIDSVASDKRLETKALESTGLKEKEKKYSLGDNLASVFTATQEIAADKPCTLALVPLGCGAFGNKVEDFASALNDKINSHNDKNIKPILVTRADNCVPLLKVLENNQDITFNISLENIYASWCSIWNNTNKDVDFNEDQIKHLGVMYRFFKKNLDKIDKELLKEQIFTTELKRACDNTNRGPNKRKISLELCYLIADPSFELIFQALEEAIAHYDNHTGYRGAFFNAFSGENPCLIKLRNIHKNIYNHCSAETSFNLLKELSSIVLEKKRKFPDRTPPSLLDKTFIMLEEKLKKVPHVKNHFTLEFFKKAPAPQSLTCDPVFARKGANNLNLKDAGHMNSTCKPSLN